MRNISTSITFILVSSLVACYTVIAPPEPSEAAARLIRVPLQRSIIQSAGTLGQPVVNYFSTVNIGTPSVSFKVQFDVGFNEHFVPHYSWNPFNTNLHYKSGFQCKSSKSCKKTNVEYTVNYQHVKLTGKPYEDVVSLMMGRANNTLGSPINSTIATPNWRQNFLAMSSASDGRFSSLPIDGFFGLGPAPQSSSGINSLLVSLHNSNLIDNLQFSIWFNPILDSSYGGELIMGGVDTSRYDGQIFWHHLSGVATNQWLLNLQQVNLGNQVVGCSGGGKACQAALSSGSSDILGPRDEVQKIYSLLNTSKSSTGLALIDCRRIADLPYITFFVDGIPYYLLPSNYIRKTVDGHIFKKETCYVAILPSNDDASRVWTLTTPFLGAFYSVFDVTQRQVGFAALK